MANTTGQKFGGRTKGTPNRTTKETKEMLQKIVSKEIDNLGEMLEKLEPLERVNAIAKLLPYIVPKQSEVAITEPEDQTIRVTIKRNEDN